MTDKEILKDILKSMRHDTLLATVLELSSDVVKWQQRYNEAAVKIEEVTDKQQMKVLVEEPIKVALSRVGAYNDDTLQLTGLAMCSCVDIKINKNK